MGDEKLINLFINPKSDYEDLSQVSEMQSLLPEQAKFKVIETLIALNSYPKEVHSIICSILCNFVCDVRVESLYPLLPEILSTMTKLISEDSSQLCT
jgi:hypothetical protein